MNEIELIRQWIRWRENRENRTYTQKSLAVDSGIQAPYLSRILSGNIDPGKKVLSRLASAFGVTLSDFLAGPPPRTREQAPQETPPPIPLYSMDGEKVGELSREKIPLLTSIPAGPWKTWLDTYPAGFGEDAVPRLGVKGRHVFAIRVDGDSMAPDLQQGDVLVLNPERAFTNFKGGIGVVKHDDSFKIRRVWHRGDNYLLEASNKAYEPEIVPVTGTTIYKIVEWRPKREEMF